MLLKSAVAALSERPQALVLCLEPSEQVLDRYSLVGVSASDPVVWPSSGWVELSGVSAVTPDAGAGVTVIVKGLLTARPLSGPPGISIRTTFVPGT